MLFIYGVIFTLILLCAGEHHVFILCILRSIYFERKQRPLQKPVTIVCIKAENQWIRSDTTRLQNSILWTNDSHQNFAEIEVEILPEEIAWVLYQFWLASLFTAKSWVFSFISLASPSPLSSIFRIWREHVRNGNAEM